jgi:hypothetical protein
MEMLPVQLYINVSEGQIFEKNNIFDIYRILYCIYKKKLHFLLLVFACNLLIISSLNGF